MPKEVIHLRGLPDDATCDVHDWPDDGMGRRLVEAMRATHGKGGVNACGPCVQRARLDAKLKAALPGHTPRRVLYVALDLARNMLNVVAGDEESLAWLDAPERMEIVKRVYDSMKGQRIAPDPPPGNTPLPAGIYGPKLIAAMLRSALRAAFPEETIEVEPYPGDDSSLLPVL